jgi:T5orf172 domain.
MPGIVKIGMTQRDPDLRLREINSATGVLPFAIEAVVASRNAKWTEREVHERLAGRRVRDNREFFRIGAEEARRIVFDVARRQRQRAYGAASWRRKMSPIPSMMLAAAMTPPAWAAHPLLPPVWLAACACASVTRHPRFIREYLSLPIRTSGAMAAVLVGVAASLLVRPEWISEAADTVASISALIR